MPEQTLLAFCSAFYEDPALNELAGAVDARLAARLAPGTLLLSTGLPAQAVITRLVAAPPVFARQVHTIVERVPRGADAAETARSVLATAAAQADGQGWLVCEVDGRRSPAASAVGEALAACGAAHPEGQAGVRDGGPRQQFAPHERGGPDLPPSVEGLGPPIAVLHGDQVYAGRAHCGAGLPAPCWPGGRPLLQRREPPPSRSALKLLEALQVFGVPVPAGAAALDLGAAPGGWTWVLARRGARVVAVDPGALDPAVEALPAVAYRAQTAQAFLRENRRRFAFIINDMRLDARESARIMVQAAAALDLGGLAIMTLKLPRHAPTAVVRQAREILAAAYPSQRARCLYYNRNEVTVALRAVRRPGGAT